MIQRRCLWAVPTTIVRGPSINRIPTIIMASSTPQRRSARISAAAAQDAVSQRSPAELTDTKGRSGTVSRRKGASNGQTAEGPRRRTSSAKTTTTTTTAAKKATKRKTMEKKQQQEDEKLADTPSTPKRKRTSNAQDDGAAPSFQPTTPKRTTTTTTKKKKNNDGGGGDGSAPDLNRPVDPHHSTATLVTPHGSHITAYPSNLEHAPSPSKKGQPRPSATTGNILQQGIAHLVKVEPRLQHIVDKCPSPPFGPADLAEEIDPFRSLTSGVIGQQVSGAAAKSIKNKFIALFNNNNNKSQASEPEESNTNGNGNNNEEYDYNDSANPRFPTPEDVARCDIPTLRTAGLSQRKAEYIQGLAQKFAAGELSARMLLTASDEEVLATLIAVRGLGQWSVEMFSCFGLKRLDVFSTGDLGVQRGMAAFAGRDVNKLKAKGGGKFKYMSEKDMLEIAAPFSPYRSLFMWYMWRWEDVDVSVMQN